MSKVLDMLRRGKSRTGALVAIVAAAVIVPATLYAWGPGRTTFTEANPAPYVTFNSITDNRVYGDERDFVMIKDASNKQDGGWSNTATAEPGKEYVVRMYVHNNAASSRKLVAENVRASASIKQGTAKNISVSGFINSSNANPTQVWDDAALTSDKDFNVNYVPGSATFHNNSVGSAPSGVALPDSIMTSGGATLGYDKLDGKIPGCYEYSGYVYFRVKPQFAPTNSFDTTKQVRKSGETTWQKNVNANPGDEVEYLLSYKNTGQSRQDNVVMKDTLPRGVSYIPGTTYLKNAANPSSVKISDNVTTANGININSYTPGSNAYVTFKAKVASNSHLEVCGPNKLTNKVRTSVDGGYKEDTADVTVNKECQPNKIQVCDLTTKQIVTINEDQFDASKYSKNIEDCKEKTMIVCELPTKKIVTIKESEFDASKYSKNLDDCKETPSQMIVCDLTTKQIVTINEDQFDASKYSKNIEDCNTPVTPPTPTTPTTPATPTELPQTGASDGVLTIAGLATLALVLGYAVTARRTLG